VENAGQFPFETPAMPAENDLGDEVQIRLAVLQLELLGNIAQRQKNQLLAGRKPIILPLSPSKRLGAGD
jgi:hypothetical protein